MKREFVPSKAVIYWLYLGIVLVLGMVVIGGMTRLTHSGLSMVHWTFTGSLPPTNDVAWQAEFEKYQQSPEFKELHTHFKLAEFKSIYWWEYIHRMFGRMIGLVFIFPFIFFLLKKKIPKSLLPHFFTILALGAFQAFLGWYMVKSGLVDVPRVSHYRLAAHLSTAFIACSYILWVALRYRYFGEETRSVLSDRKNAIAIGLMVFTQIVWGAFVAGLKAGWVHNTWPLMDGNIISPAVTAMEPFLSNFIEGKSGVQFVHRTLGLIIVGFVSFVLYKALKTEKRTKKSILIVASAIFIQFTLGVLTLLLEVPISLGVIHQVMALIVLLTVVNFYYQSTYRIEKHS
ncbi:MAG: COX15/CtaA family protein [Salibacteraceae bacterium]|nr:COX15/CtaA family protein [Salibacteraceae bacterium]